MIGAVALSMVALSDGDAPAAPLTVQLEYLAGAGCPDAADFKAVVIARLGYDPFVEGAPERVLVRLEPRERTVDGRIEWRDTSGKWAGEQTFPSVSTDCPRLARAMGFALAVQIQLLARAASARDANAVAPGETASPPRGDAATMANPPIPTTPPPAAPTVSAAAPAPASGPRPAFGLGAGSAVGFGVSSQPVLLGRLFGVLAWPHAALELGALVSVPATTRRPGGAGFSQQLLLVSAAACATSTRWSACAVANAGAVRMAGEDIDQPTSASAPVVEAGARVGLIQRIGAHVFLSGHADGLVNVTRWTGTLDHVPVWTAPPFAGAIGVDAGVRFR